MKFAPLTFALVKKRFLYIWDCFRSCESIWWATKFFQTQKICRSFLTAMLTGKLHRYNHHDHHQGPPAHQHCVELTVSADEHGVVDKGQGREQRRQGESKRSRSQHLTLFSLVSLLSFVFSPQLNFLFRCLSSLFAHSQHPPPPLHSSPFLYYPISQKPRNFPFSSSHCLFLKSGIVMLVWPLILFFRISNKTWYETISWKTLDWIWHNYPEHEKKSITTKSTCEALLLFTQGQGPQGPVTTFPTTITTRSVGGSFTTSLLFSLWGTVNVIISLFL